jgi:hypothetical protein
MILFSYRLEVAVIRRPTFVLTLCCALHAFGWLTVRQVVNLAARHEIIDAAATLHDLVAKTICSELAQILLDKLHDVVGVHVCTTGL